MKLNDEQIGILKLRTYLGKIGVPADPRYNKPDSIQALIDLIKGGVIVAIDRYTHPELRILVDVYKLTEKGERLVEEQEIIATNPGSPATDYGAQ